MSLPKRIKAKLAAADGPVPSRMRHLPYTRIDMSRDGPERSRRATLRSEPKIVGDGFGSGTKLPRMKSGSLVGVLVLSALGMAVLTAAGEVMAQAAAIAERSAAPCVVDPDGKSGEGDDRSTKLSPLLDECGGVLEPAPPGDPEFVESAPDAGRTPVIPPSQLPDQQNADTDEPRN